MPTPVEQVEAFMQTAVAHVGDGDMNSALRSALQAQGMLAAVPDRSSQNGASMTWDRAAIKAFISELRANGATTGTAGEIQFGECPITYAQR